jgi:hypothetical protein
MLSRIQRLVVGFFAADSAATRRFLTIIRIVVTVDKGLIRAEVLSFRPIVGAGHRPDLEFGHIYITKKITIRQHAP